MSEADDRPVTHGELRAALAMVIEISMETTLLAAEAVRGNETEAYVQKDKIMRLTRSLEDLVGPLTPSTK